MAAETWVNDNGTARRLRELWVNDNGIARRLNELWVNDNGTPRRIFLGIQITAPADIPGIIAGGGGSGYTRFTPNGSIISGGFFNIGGVAETNVGSWIGDPSLASQVEIRATVLSADTGFSFFPGNRYGSFFNLGQEQRFDFGFNPVFGSGIFSGNGVLRFDFRAGGNIIASSTHTNNFLAAGL